MKAALALACVLALSCGDDGSNPCPTGDCNVDGHTVVKWRFNHFPMMGFDSDTCSDLQVATVHVEITNTADATITDVQDKQCPEGQASFLGLPQGTYNVAVTPMDANGNPLTSAAAAGMTTAAAPNTSLDVTVDVNYPLWTQPYTGQLLFRLKWGGMSCPTDVTTQTLTLTAGGVPRHETASIDNTEYQKLDGTETKNCVPFTQQFPMNVMGLPFGPATLLVIGKNTTGDVTFQHTFDTFVGAGLFNPTLEYDSPVMDAGVPMDVPSDI